ncbi:hypothetical protein DK1_000015 [Bacillus phage DK1]|uniref:Uncharacterized protein n=1 Tax=Bacillus phage DK1 TaxID=2500808 RepID=A0A3T0IIY1_9CAUD|nr:hypothetical protein H3016_gp15 [Bacillus phage DK1]AZU99719.1 hypothetical protein DK1_000015 [Bacillus phage DK1]
MKTFIIKLTGEIDEKTIIEIKDILGKNDIEVINYQWKEVEK